MGRTSTSCLITTKLRVYAPAIESWGVCAITSVPPNALQILSQVRGVSIGHTPALDRASMTSAEFPAFGAQVAILGLREIAGKDGDLAYQHGLTRHTVGTTTKTGPL